MGLTGRWRIAAAVWGFAEATLFFTVPDVLLTLAAIRLGWRAALGLVPVVLIGALLGGAGMYGLAAHDFETARVTVDSVPLISAQMIDRAQGEMQGAWLWNMIIGAITGTPYKVYAITTPGAGVSLTEFMLGSVAARPFRWVLTLGFAALITAALTRKSLQRFAVPLWAVMWIGFYVFYYGVMSL